MVNTEGVYWDRSCTHSHVLLHDVYTFLWHKDILSNNISETQAWRRVQYKISPEKVGAGKKMISFTKNVYSRKYLDVRRWKASLHLSVLEDLRAFLAGKLF